MDAPLITARPRAANTADVYAFRSVAGGVQYLTVAVTVYPFEEPGIGPNKYNFRRQRALHCCTWRRAATWLLPASLTYQFEFKTSYKTRQGTILQSYLGVVQSVDDAART